jgi:hypothetical protein
LDEKERSDARLARIERNNEFNKREEASSVNEEERAWQTRGSEFRERGRKVDGITREVLRQREDLFNLPKESYKRPQYS